VWPEQQTRRNETFLVFAHPAGPVGNVVSKATNELVIPNFKQTWADIRKLANAPEAVRHLSFKVQGFKLQRDDDTVSELRLRQSGARDAARLGPDH